jgi:COP9 signalosome complex subunit 7
VDYFKCTIQKIIIDMTASSSSSASTLIDEFYTSKSPLSPASLHSLLQRLLTHPRIHNGFVDILQLPSVQSTLENMDPAKRDSLVTSVKLFAFGTIREYQALKERDGDAVWTLTDAQLDKLRMLSVVSVARRGKNKSCEKADVEMISSDHAAVQNDSSLSIPYAILATELQITPVGTPFNDKDHLRQLEDVLIQCVYSNIIVGKLDQASRAFVVESHVALQEQQLPSSSLGMRKKDDGAHKSTITSNTVHGSLLSRDIDTTTAASTNTEVKRMISTLEDFLSSSNKLLSSLEDISNVSAAVRKEDEKRWRNVEKKLAEEGSGGSRFRAPGGDCDIIFEGGSDPMEVVDMSGRRKVKRSRGGHMGGRY